MALLKGAALAKSREDLGKSIRAGFEADDAGAGGGAGEVPGGDGGEAAETPPGGAGAQEIQEPAPAGDDGGEAPQEPQGAAKPPPAAAGGLPPAGWKAPTYAEHAALTAKVAELEKGQSTTVRKQVQSILESFAEQDPAIYRALYQEEPPADMFPDGGKPAAAATPAPGTRPPSAAPAAGAPPATPAVDPAFLKRLERVEGHITQSQRIEVRKQIYNQAAAAADKFPIFVHPKFGLIAEKQLLAAISKNPRGDYETMAKEVSDGLEQARKADRDEYINGKKQVASKVPAGAGPAGGAPPGTPQPKLKLGRGKGSTMEGLSNHLRAVAKAEQGE